MIGVIPESVEFDALACLEARTASLANFRDLGAVDLVQLTKNKQGTETSTYHFVSGINVSSSAAVAAHLNTLTFSLGDNQMWFGSHRRWKITNGTYCSWNAFSNLDVRVKAAIPGGVEEYTVSPHGTVTQTVSEQCWLETYMSAMVRSLLYADDDAFFVECCRKEDPFATRTDFMQFLHAFEALFGMGPQLGSSPKHQLSTLTANYMVDAFFIACEVTCLWDEAKQCIERISQRVPQARDLLVRVNLLSNHEIEAVRLMVEIVEANPRNAEVLAQEANFCLSKPGKAELAYDCALRSSAASPGQFFTWEVLAKVYVKLGRYADALLALNSRPMVFRAPMDTVKMPTPRKIHSPLPSDGVIEDIWNLNTSEVDPVDPNLLKLTGGSLRGGSKWAYDIIAQILAEIGWTELMRTRGDIFLMEQEAHKETATAEESSSDSKEKDGKNLTIIVTPPESAQSDSNEVNGAIEKEEYASESDVEANGNGTPVDSDDTTLDQPKDIHAAPQPSQQAFQKKSIKSKRLCERRLDMLFMTLWEDARAHSHWQREAVHFESAQTTYTKTATEWEILGCVAQRLHYDDQAIEAFKKSLSKRFCHRVAWHLLDYYAPVEGKVNNPSLALQLIVKLYAWNHRWHTEFSPRLRITLNRIVASEGLLKVLTEVQASFVGEGVVRLIELELGKIKTLPG